MAEERRCTRACSYSYESMSDKAWNSHYENEPEKKRYHCSGSVLPCHEGGSCVLKSKSKISVVFDV